MNRPSHRGLAQYLERHGLADAQPRTDGSIVLMFGERLRVFARPGLRGEVVFECRLTPIDLKTRQGEDRMVRALDAAGNRWLRSSEALVLSPQEDMLLLQQPVAADSQVDEVEGNLHAFVDAVGFWRSCLGVL